MAVSSERQAFAGVSPNEPADLFCALYDATDGMAFRRSVERWDRDRNLTALAAEVERETLAGSLDVAARWRRARDDEHRYGVLRGLDAAFASANPALSAVPPQALAGPALRYAAEGRLDSGAIGGALLPRFAGGGRRGQLPDDLAGAFGAVVRVPQADWVACDHATLPAWARLTRPDRETGLRVATTPFIADPDELHWQVHERADLRFYRIAPADRPVTRARTARVIDRFDAGRATIAMAPELCLTRSLLGDWGAALRGRPDACSSPLRLVLAGTGDLEGAGARPSNTAVLMDASTGEVLVRQRKIHPFNLSEADAELWGLTGRLGAPVDEDLDPGERVCVVEAGGVRLAVLVCEDLARVPRLAGPLCTHGISLILVPVFARPTKDRRWERTRAESYSDATGAAIVVANSLVMATVLGTELPAGTAIAVAPGAAAVAQCSAPDEASFFVLSDGAPVVDA